MGSGVIEPTYSTIEALHMMEKLQHDEDGLASLGRLITEEKKRYTLYDLKLLKFYFDCLMLRYFFNS